MYTLTFTNWQEEQTVRTFECWEDAINAAVELQVREGGYYTSGEWFYEVKDSSGNLVHSDDSFRVFDYELM